MSKYFAYLLPPEGVEVRERLNDFFWFDDKGIVYSVPKEVQVAQTLEEANKDIQEWRAEFGEEKMNCVSVINPHAKSTKEQRDWVAEVLPSLINSWALINDSALGRMAVNLFIGLRPPEYQLKVFRDSESAKEWIKQFVKDE